MVPLHNAGVIDMQEYRRVPLNESIAEMLCFWSVP